MYLRGHESRLFSLHPPSLSGPVPGLMPAMPDSSRADPVPRGHAVGWSWEAYATQLNVPPERIDIGQRLVAGIMAAVRERGLPWQVVMRKGYVAIQRPGGYNGLVVDVWWDRVPRLAAKIPAEPATLGLTSPFPPLPEVWTPAEHEWGWTVAPGTPLPDVGTLIDLVLPFQPAQGPMTTPDGRGTVVGDIRAEGSTHQAVEPPDEVLKEAIQRLEGSGASRNIREAADSLRAMGYELRLAKTTVPGKRPENYLRIMDPQYTAHGIGYLTPTTFSFSRAIDRERLARLPGATLANSSVNFLHADSAQPGLAAARLLKEGRKE
jgi:hypothetical protein